MDVKRPNIVHLISHDMGRELGCYGRPATTPHFDRIASRGVRFANYFCPAAQCSPSRGSISTGLYPHSNGLIGLTHYDWKIRDGIKKMPQYFNELGYETWLIGGHHEAPRRDGDQKAVASLGYEHFITTADLDEMPLFHYIGSCYEKLSRHIDTICAGDKPFFLNIGTNGAHRAYKDYKHGVVYPKHNPLKTPVPPYLPDRHPIREDTAYMYGMIEREDEFTGKIFDLLERKGLLESTLIVLTTDHGVPMPRAKGTCFDPGLETYLIMYWKGHIEGGTTYPQLLSNVDLLPTYIEAAGGTAPQGLDGRSFWPLLTDGHYEERDHLFAEMTWHDRYNPMRAIRTKQHKYIRNYGRRPKVYIPVDIFRERAGQCMMPDYYFYSRAPEELYDLCADPLEQTNLAERSEHHDTLLHLRNRVEQWMRRTDDALLRGDIEPTAAQRHVVETAPYYN